MTVDIGSFLQYGAIGLVAFIFLMLHLRTLKRQDDREDAIRKELAAERLRAAAELAAHRTACKEESTGLIDRIRMLEDQSRTDHQTVITSALRTLELQAQAVARWAESDSGKHPVRR